MVGTVALSLFLSWVQVSSDTYIVKSSAGEGRAIRVLRELEHFHQLIGTLVFRNTELPELPIEVLLVGDEQALKELEPDVLKPQALIVLGIFGGVYLGATLLLGVREAEQALARARRLLAR